MELHGAKPRIEQGLVPFRYLYPNRDAVLDTFKTLRETELVLMHVLPSASVSLTKIPLFRRSINAHKIPVIQFEYV